MSFQPSSAFAYIGHDDPHVVSIVEAGDTVSYLFAPFSSPSATPVGSRVVMSEPEAWRERMPTLPEDLSEYARIHTGPGSWSAESFEQVRGPELPTPQAPYVTLGDTGSS